MIRSKTYHPLNLFRACISRLMLGFALLFLSTIFFAKDLSLSKDSLGKTTAQLSAAKIPEAKRSISQNQESEKENILKKGSSSFSNNDESKSTIYVAEGTIIYSATDQIFATVTKLELGAKDKETSKISSKKKKLQVEKKIFSAKKYKNPTFKQVFNYRSVENNSQFSSQDVSAGNAVVPNISSKNKEAVATLNGLQSYLHVKFKAERTLIKFIFIGENIALKTFHTRPPPSRI